MPPDEESPPAYDWSLATFEGARREQIRRWSQLPLEDILRAIEEMHEVARQLGAMPKMEIQTSHVPDRKPE